MNEDEKKIEDGIDGVVEDTSTSAGSNEDQGVDIVPPTHNDEPANEDQGNVIVPVSGETGMMGADVENFYTAEEHEQQLVSLCVRKYVKGEGEHPKLILNSKCYMRVDRETRVDGKVELYPCYLATGVKPTLYEELKDGGIRVTYSDGQTDTYESKAEFNRWAFIETEPSVVVDKNGKKHSKWNYTNTSVLCCGNAKGFYRNDYLEDVRKMDEAVIEKMANTNTNGLSAEQKKKLATLVEAITAEISKIQAARNVAQEERDNLKGEIETLEADNKKKKAIIKVVAVVLTICVGFGLAVAGHFLYKHFSQKAGTDNNITPGGGQPVGPDINPDDGGKKDPDINPDVDPDQPDVTPVNYAHEYGPQDPFQDTLHDAGVLEDGEKVLGELGKNGNKVYLGVEDAYGNNCVYVVVVEGENYTLDSRYIEYTGADKAEIGANIAGVGFDSTTDKVFIEFETNRINEKRYSYESTMNGLVVEPEAVAPTLVEKENVAVAKTATPTDTNHLVNRVVDSSSTAVEGSVKVTKGQGEVVSNADQYTQAQAAVDNYQAEVEDTLGL